MCVCVCVCACVYVCVCVCVCTSCLLTCMLHEHIECEKELLAFLFNLWMFEISVSLLEALHPPVY